MNLPCLEYDEGAFTLAQPVEDESERDETEEDYVDFVQARAAAAHPLQSPEQAFNRCRPSCWIWRRHRLNRSTSFEQTGTLYRSIFGWGLKNCHGDAVAEVTSPEVQFFMYQLFDPVAGSLAKMRITDVTVTLWTWDNIPPAGYVARAIASSWNRCTQMGLVRIVTDEEVDGYAFLGSAVRSAEHDAVSLIEHFKPMLLGEDAFARERLWQTMMRGTRGGTLHAVGAVDVALWDLAGRAAGIPVHRLMGSYRESVPVYASSAVLPSPQAYADEAVRLKEAGWTAYKIHPPARPAVDIEICTAVRKAVGNDYRLMLDALWSYNYVEALKVGRAIEDLGFYWFEDPLAEDDLYNYVKLKQNLSIPIMATEMPSGGPTAYAPWVLAHATDFLRGDVALKGGLTSCLKTAHLAEGFHMNYEVHHGGNSLNNVANLHLLMAIPNCEYMEVRLPDEANKHGLIEDIDVDKEGRVHVFNGAGLGARVDFEMIESRKTAFLS